MMTDFIAIVQNVMEDQGKSLEELFKNNIISKDTFYKYKKRSPRWQSFIKNANYLETSIDYMYKKTDNNNFQRYSTNQSDFYKNLQLLIKLAGISNRQFCKDLHYSKNNILKYKKGVIPSIRTIFEITNYFDCSIDDLLIKET